MSGRGTPGVTPSPGLRWCRDGAGVEGMWYPLVVRVFLTCGEIADSAHKHGLSDDDIWHAWRNVLRVAEQEYDGEAGSSPSVPPTTAPCWN